MLNNYCLILKVSLLLLGVKFLLWVGDEEYENFEKSNNQILYL